MLSEMGYFEAKPAPADLLPDGISNSYPHVALFTTKFCKRNMPAMLETGKRLKLCDDVLLVTIDGVAYRAFCFAEQYHATAFAACFDALHFDAGHGPVIRLTC